MGQKVNPLGFRIGIIEDWRSRWYATKKDFAALLLEDSKIRKFVKKECYSAAVSRIDIERTRESVKVYVHTARPGILIGKRGQRSEELRGELERITGRQVKIQFREVDKPDLSSQLVAEAIAEQLVKRAAFRRVLKKTALSTMQQGAEGIKITIAGRLGGAEMARREKLSIGKIPLQTLTADVDYGFAEARTTAGIIGVKVWIYRGEKMTRRG
ncbi:MAG: 30S ribosomal protein S3 [Planctomycetota bacterium]|jgi:small subunit ribosomal protein S3